MNDLDYIIYGTMSLAISFGIPILLGFWYGYEKGKANGFERK